MIVSLLPSDLRRVPRPNWGCKLAVIIRVVKDLIRDISAAASLKGLHDDLIYLNYASDEQDLIAGYGAENVGKLKAVSRKYDPKQVFQRQVPGGFKLPAWKRVIKERGLRRVSVLRKLLTCLNAAWSLKARDHMSTRRLIARDRGFVACSDDGLSCWTVRFPTSQYFPLPKKFVIFPAEPRAHTFQ